VNADELVRLLKAKMTLIRDHFRDWERPLGSWLLRVGPLGRYVTLSLVAAFTNHPSARESAQVWGEVWTRRTEWQDGLRESPVPVTSSK
jgi:hypothetical protein